MPSAKEQIAHIVQEQPEDSSYDEILRELALARMIERGLEDSQVHRGHEPTRGSSGCRGYYEKVQLLLNWSYLYLSLCGSTDMALGTLL